MVDPGPRLAALEQLALEKAPADALAYVNAAAGDSAHENLRAWARYPLRPRMLRDVSAISLTTTLLGAGVSSPVVVAPTAMHRLVCPDGELATSRAAAATGSLYVLSMAATTALEDVAGAAPDGLRWMQMYVQRDRGWTREICERAAAAGYRALVVTVDSPVADTARRPHGRINGDHHIPNLAPLGDTAPDIYDLVLGYEPGLTVDDLVDLQAWSGGLPLVVKGIVRGDDAVACVDAGVSAICVSNHGGRLLDGCIGTADALVDVVDAVGDRAEVYVDGGIRCGADALKALALGARAVLVGRPVVWGLAVDGEAGATAVLRELHHELALAMGLCGVVRADDVPADLVTRPGPD